MSVPRTLEAPGRSLVQVNHTAKAKVRALKAESDSMRPGARLSDWFFASLRSWAEQPRHRLNGSHSSTPENVSELLEEGSLFTRHVAIALIGVAPEIAASMPYVVMFGIILAVLSFCAFSRQTEDGAFLVNRLARSTASTVSASEKAAARAARAGPRPARTRPPELSPQAQSGQSSEQSPLISLCPQLVVPEKVECTLLVPLVGPGLTKRASSLPVSDVKGETIFLLETVPDGRSSDGTRQSGLCHCILTY